MKYMGSQRASKFFWTPYTFCFYYNEKSKTVTTKTI